MFETQRYGAIAESLFIARCLKKHNNASRPAADMDGYDFIVSTPSLANYRVQVKSTVTPEANKSGVYRVKVKSESKRDYTSLGVEFVVCYLHSIEAFYIIPVEVLKKKMHIRVYPYKADCKFAIYREAWHQFK